MFVIELSLVIILYECMKGVTICWSSIINSRPHLSSYIKQKRSIDSNLSYTFFFHLFNMTEFGWTINMRLTTLLK